MFRQPRPISSIQPPPHASSPTHSSPTHPALFFAGSKVPNGTGSADQVATRWARILLGFCRFACVLTGDAGGCDVPLEWLVPHDAAQGRYVNPTNACQSFQPHPSTFAFSGFEGAKRHVLTGGAGGCDVPLEWLVPHDAAQGRYVNPTNACQSFQPHPSTFAFSGFEGAKRHRLCRPSGNPLGLNPAGVLPFRMRAHRRGWRL